MKTQCLEASVAAHSSPRIFARGDARLQATGGMRQIVNFPCDGSVRSFQCAKERCFAMCSNARTQLIRAWKNASSLFTYAMANAKAWSSRILKMSSARISRGTVNLIKQSTCAWKRIRVQQIVRSKSKRLHVAESVSLGEKRFVAVIKVDGREFLIGGGATNVVLLAQLDAKTSFDGILTEEIAVSKKQPAKRTRRKVAKPPVEKPGRQS